MGERKNNERRKLEGKRQKQIAKTDEKVRFLKKRLKRQCNWQGKQNRVTVRKVEKWRDPSVSGQIL